MRSRHHRKQFHGRMYVLTIPDIFAGSPPATGTTGFLVPKRTRNTLDKTHPQRNACTGHIPSKLLRAQVAGIYRNKGVLQNTKCTRYLLAQLRRPTLRLLAADFRGSSWSSSQTLSPTPNHTIPHHYLQQAQHHHHHQKSTQQHNTTQHDTTQHTHTHTTSQLQAGRGSTPPTC